MGIPAALFILALIVLAQSLSSMPCTTKCASSSSASLTNTSSETILHVTSPEGTNSLEDHWVKGWGYRDELNPVDSDFQNFWIDNAGKIALMSLITGDVLDEQNSVSFIERIFKEGYGYYTPEVLVNSTLLPLQVSDGIASISNRLVELVATNSSSSPEQELAIGVSYPGSTELGFLAADRLDLKGAGCCFRASSSEVFAIKSGFSKRSFFDVRGNTFYTFLNASLESSYPYVQVTLQLEPISTVNDSVNYLYLQVFNSTSSQTAFDSESILFSNGTVIKNSHSGAFQAGSSSGIVLAYSQNDSIFTSVNSGKVSGQDAVAIKYDTQNLYDLEYWPIDRTGFSGQSWFGAGYQAPSTLQPQELSPPVSAKIYPIFDFDYRLVNDTLHFINLNESDVAVSPPAGFGFLSLALALLAERNSSYTNTEQAREYWNYYYSRYWLSTNDFTSYARSTSIFSLAGFEIYGCGNQSVVNFTRRFAERVRGDSVEEYAWTAAALHSLAKCTHNPSDWQAYNSTLNSIVPSRRSYIELETNSSASPEEPVFTFQFGETLSALLLRGGAAFNQSALLAAANAVYEANSTGVPLNEPHPGADLANTEALPAMMLGTYLFEGEMKNETGYWITHLSNVNLTYVNFSDSHLTLGVEGSNGTMVITNGSILESFSNILGKENISITASSSCGNSSTSCSSSLSASSSSPCRRLICIPFLELVIVAASLLVGAGAFVVITRRRGSSTGRN